MLNSEVINELIELLSDESKHTKFAFARDEKHQPCSATSPLAVCWCLTGALIKIERDHDTAFCEAFNIIERAINALDDKALYNMSAFNDNFGYNTVVNVLHKAKELAIAQEQAQCETQKHTTT